ncbi:hypothetical protein MLD38_002048 [Melastoma candidum]|uniref:Uncharacterized protein n=1 Tax=Melastoma candidum TaxID=119954 RepID=A0ACB9SFM2_9MYRT|nr:hypothetical protein MLD38_002048 [Melastoma candidum]
MLHWGGFAVPMKRFRRLDRQKGHRKLRHDVKRCEYEDVHVMWEILSGKVEDPTSPPHPGARDNEAHLSIPPYNLSDVSDRPCTSLTLFSHLRTSTERPPVSFLLMHTKTSTWKSKGGFPGHIVRGAFGRRKAQNFLRNMKIWVVFCLAGATLLFFSASGTTSDSDLHVNHQVDEMANLSAGDILSVMHEDGSVSLEDYQPSDPSPSSKKSVKPGPIEHGAPLMPFLPIPSPAVPPASSPTCHG